MEVKENADQETVGQVLKQSNGFKDMTGSAMVRKALVALRPQAAFALPAKTQE